MFEQLGELEQRIGYHFHNRDNLRRALSCQSAINERHSDATNQNFQVLEFLGDAALKYAVATLLYIEQNDLGAVEGLHDKVVPFISNSKLSSIGHELNLNKYIIKGKGVLDSTDKMLADAVEAILGAIVIDQQQQGNVSENVLFDVIARLWSIKRKGRSMAISPIQNNENKKRCTCCKCICVILVIIVIFAVIMVFVAAEIEL
jgi:ribonuclease-3